MESHVKGNDLLSRNQSNEENHLVLQIVVKDPSERDSFNKELQCTIQLEQNPDGMPDSALIQNIIQPGNEVLGSSSYFDDEKDECGVRKEGAPRGDLKDSLESHAGVKPYSCNVCDKTFRRWRGLKIHQKTHVDPEDDKIVCEVCGKKFTHLSSLVEHRHVHSSDRPFVCHICQKDFSSKKNFMFHYRRHQEVKPHICDVCKKGFIHLSLLKKHQIIHTGEKPYVCDLCLRGFAFLENYNKHKLTHTGERPHECGVCNKRFTQVGNLQKHMLIHTGEKPFLCDLCSMAFSSLASLERHYLTHTGEKPHYCRICSVGFIQKNNLERHFKTQKHKLMVKESGLHSRHVLSHTLSSGQGSSNRDLPQLSLF